jgi:hypothetical protein
MEHGAQAELGPGVAVADAGHDRGAFGGGEDVGHGGKSVGTFNIESATLNVEGKMGLTAEAQRSPRDAKEEGVSEDGFSVGMMPALG